MTDDRRTRECEAVLNRAITNVLYFLLSVLTIIAAPPALADGKCSFDRHSPEYLECVVRSFTEELATPRLQLDTYYQQQLTNLPPHLVSPSPGRLRDNSSELKEQFSRAQSSWNEYVTAL